MQLYVVHTGVSRWRCWTPAEESLLFPAVCKSSALKQWCTTSLSSKLRANKVVFWIFFNPTFLQKFKLLEKQNISSNVGTSLLALTITRTKRKKGQICSKKFNSKPLDHLLGIFQKYQLYEFIKTICLCNWNLSYKTLYPLLCHFFIIFFQYFEWFVKWLVW